MLLSELGESIICKPSGEINAMIEQQLKNPFQPFDFTLENFVGRKDILGYLKKRTQSGTREFNVAKHIVILGDGGTGKTWLLNKFFADLPDNQFHKIHLDIGNYLEDIQGFVSEFMRQANYSPRVQVSFKGFMKSLSIGFPLGVSISPGALVTNQLPVSTDERLRSLIAHLIQSAKENRKFLILAFDQYGLIPETKGGISIARYLATLIKECNEANLSKILLLFALRPEHKGVLEHFFESEIFNPVFVDRFSLHCFSKEEALLAISKPAHSVGVRFDQRTVEAILEQLGQPNPYYLQLACRLIWDQVLNTTGYMPETLYIPPTEVQEILAEGQARIFRQFNESEKEVLKILAQSHPIPTSVRQLQQRLESIEVSEVVDKLVKHPGRPLSYIDASSAYRINHDLFADYILQKECAPEAHEIAVLQGILDYAPGLFSITEFMLDEKLLDRIWVFRHRLQFPDDTLHAIARSILHLETKKWEVHFQWFASLKGKFADALISLSTDQDDKVRLGAMKAMGMTGYPQCCNALFKGLSDEDAEVRKAAAVALGNIQDEVAVPALMAALEDEDSSVRSAAAEALGQVKVELALSTLERSLISDQDHPVKRAAAQAIVAIGGNRALEALTEALRKGSKEARLLAIQYLADLPHDAVKVMLLNQLRSNDPNIRWQVVESLARLKAPEAVSRLVRRINDPSLAVAQASVEALGQIGNAPAIRSLFAALSSPQPPIRLLAFDTFKSMAASTIMEQFSWKRGEPNWSKLLKARLLARTATDAAFEHLRVLFNDSDEVVRAQFVRCLSNFSNDLIQPFLAQALNDESCLIRKAALEVISRRDVETLRLSVEALYDDPNRAVRWLARRIINMQTRREALAQSETSEAVMGVPLALPDSVESAYQAQLDLMQRTLFYDAMDDLPAGPISALKSTDPEVRCCALKILSVSRRYGTDYDVEKVNDLVESLLSSEPEVWVKTMAIKAIHIDFFDTVDSLTVRRLLKALKDDHWLIRTTALEKLFESQKPPIYQEACRIISRQVGDDIILSIIDLERLKKRINPKGHFTGEIYECEEIVKNTLHKLRQKVQLDNFGNHLPKGQEGEGK